MSDTHEPTRVLITGANGLVGNIIFAHLAKRPERYDAYGSARRRQPSSRLTTTFAHIPDDRLRIADLTDVDALRAAVDGMDAVVHMAASPDSGAPWDSVLSNNIIGAHNLFEACRQAGVRRVIFASTNQVVFGYRDSAPYSLLFQHRFGELDLAVFRPITHEQPARPENDYAASKVYGEALARMFSQRHGLSCISLRVGWVTSDDRLPHPMARALWCSHRDIAQIATRCIDAPPSLRHDVFFGQSANTYNLVDIAHARDVLGYAPQDNAEARWDPARDAPPWR